MNLTVFGPKVVQLEMKTIVDDAVNLTSEKHDPNAQTNHLQKEEKKRPCRRHRCGADQVPSEGQVRNILTTLEC